MLHIKLQGNRSIDFGAEDFLTMPHIKLQGNRSIDFGAEDFLSFFTMEMAAMLVM